MRQMSIGLVIPALAFAVSTAPAQTGTAAPDPIARAIASAWDGAKRNITESADQMPEADYGFKPVDSVRSFGAILAHIAGANYVYCSAAKGETPPHAEDEFERTATTKAAIRKALSDSIAYCDEAYSGLDAGKAAETVGAPFGSGRSTRAAVLIGNAGHLNEHYGNLVTYFRIKGMVPPSSRR